MSSNDKFLQNVVQIQQGSSVGTGFFIGKDGTLLTCFHVIGDEETGQLMDGEITVIFNEIEYPAECISSPPDPQILDMAILRLQEEKLPPGAILLPLAEWQPDNLDMRKFRTYGFRSSKFKGLHAAGEIRGYTETEAGRQLLHLASEAIGAEELRPGMSGGPVFCETPGQIVGMITERVRETRETIPCATPIEEITDIWPQIKERLLEEELLSQLPEILNEKYFTEELFKLLYDNLPLSGRPKLDDLSDEKFTDLIELLRNKGQVYDFIRWLRIKRPDIPINTLIDLPSHRISFVNRDYELREACERSSPPYMLFDAPARYGKTELLKAITQRHFHDNWLCIEVVLPHDIDSILDLLSLVYREADLANQLPVSDIDIDGPILAGLLKQRVEEYSLAGVLLTIDNVDRLPEKVVGSFLNNLIPILQRKFHRLPALRIRLAGRYVAPLWRDKSRNIKLKIITLTPFRFKYVRDTVDLLLPFQKNPETGAAHLMHITGGHPGCMAEIIRKIRPAQSSGETIEPDQASYESIVLSTARQVRRAIPETLRDAFDMLCVFRRFDSVLLEQILAFGLIDDKDDAYTLEGDLMATNLVNRKADGYIQDEIVRRLLAIRLRKEEPEQFIELCKSAKQIYELALLELPYSEHILAMECLYQELQLGYYQGGQTLSARQDLRKDFFDDDNDDGILSRYLKILSTKPHPRNLKANLIAQLEQDDSWEFRFAVNFFLRGETYNNEPFDEILQRVENYLDKK